jgi:hypothetical protein
MPPTGQAGRQCGPVRSPTPSLLARRPGDPDRRQPARHVADPSPPAEWTPGCGWTAWARQDPFSGPSLSETAARPRARRDACRPSRSGGSARRPRRDAVERVSVERSHRSQGAGRRRQRARHVVHRFEVHRVDARERFVDRPRAVVEQD